MSPTVGTYFFAKDFVRFIENMDYYLSLDLKFIKCTESKHYNELLKRNQIHVPIGVLDDVEIVFLHYQNKDIAIGQNILMTKI